MQLMEPRQVPLPGSSKSESDNIADSLRRTARKMSWDIWYNSIWINVFLDDKNSNYWIKSIYQL